MFADFMRTFQVLGIAAVMLVEAPAAVIVEADARRGADLFGTEMCLRCHSINGKGGKLGPDLSKRLDRDYTPALVASRMWNHAPAMWEAARTEMIQLPPLNEAQAADLFAYFYSVRFFEKPGDAARGRRLFSEKHCVECHSVSGSGPGKAINSWESLYDPMALLERIWNHTAQMRTAFAEKKITWPQLTAQDMADLLVYLQHMPHMPDKIMEFSLSPGESGKDLFAAKGCADCHHGKLALEGRLAHTSLTGVAAAMWNHAPDMLQMPPALSEDEMRRIVSYVWAKQFFADSGDAGRGKRVFTQKNCTACHGDPASGAPSLAHGKDAYSPVVMVAALWKHGPRMLDRMQQKNLPWPRFSGSEMSDLVAYLNTM
jgi:mono/diheme cytochrome c family protein